VALSPVVPATWEAEAGGSLELKSFEDSLSNVDLTSKKCLKF
jgi:hypothetical protein